MNDGSSANGKPLPGYRLTRLEVFNWGTFDSTGGNVHVLAIGGETSLVVGQNGSGKSTLVDALLTLLVRPGVRNYNVAAGAHKQERDERSYIKGAFGRFSRDDDNGSAVQFLRPHAAHPSVLLACFRNQTTDKAFTLAQLLYVGQDGDVAKVYCFAADERSIMKDFGDLKRTDQIREQLRRRKWRVSTSYVEYHSWFLKETGVRAKAMDMFNQTVAVKDIQKLNAFIRDHMLEAQPWGKRLDGLLNHFHQLSEAHKSLVEARRQRDLLNPIAEAGNAYRSHERQTAREQQLLEATDSFFRAQTVELFVPECARRQAELADVRTRIKQLDRDLDHVQEECRRLRNEIEERGGERLRLIPLLIENHEIQARSKREANQRFHAALGEAGIAETVAEPRALLSVRAKLSDTLAFCENQSRQIDTKRADALVKRAELSRQLREDEHELEALMKRRESLPESFAELRRRMCDDLRLPPSDLPFASELIAVRSDERAWEASIEMALRNFALSLLVPEKHYRTVSRYVDATRLSGEGGRGQKLVYLRVGQRQPRPSGPALRDRSLVGKLVFRDGHALLPWIKAELADRYDYLCCETIEEFQASEGRALTRQRHLKAGSLRHEKDDRERSNDARHFVLGWDNREKRKLLADSIQELRNGSRELDRAIDEADRNLAAIRHRQIAAQRASEIADFDAIDAATQELAIKALQKERRTIEEGNDVVRLLKRRLEEEQSRQSGLTRNRDDAVGRERELTKEIQSGERAIEKARAVLKDRAKEGALARHETSYAHLALEFKDSPLTADNLLERERVVTQARRERLDRLHVELVPLSTSLQKSMGRFLIDFPSTRTNLQPDVHYLESFLEMRAHLIREDLPRHEQRFKERLNEKVTHEIGLFHGALQTECGEIKHKIEILNGSLREVQYRDGTYMRLEPRPVRDREINEFQQSLKECLAGTFEGTLEADEARYLRIEKLIVRLREEQRWREKVADVRRWFDFGARELDKADGRERAYYEDSTGQSGGEKAKLAFTILVAAIAYQYDLVPGNAVSERFHFVVVDEMFSKVGDQYAEYALELFRQFGLQLLIVAPLDAKARVTEPYVGCYLHVVKDEKTGRSQVLCMTAREFECIVAADGRSTDASSRGSGAPVSI